MFYIIYINILLLENYYTLIIMYNNYVLVLHIKIKIKINFNIITII